MTPGRKGVLYLCLQRVSVSARGVSEECWSLQAMLPSTQVCLQGQAYGSGKATDAVDSEGLWKEEGKSPDKIGFTLSLHCVVLMK